MAAAAPGGSAPLLTKDAINIAGHKLPLPVVMAVIGVLGLLLVLRARSKGGNVASVGQAPATPPFTDPTALANLGADNSAALANLSAQLTSLQQAQQQQALPPNSTTAPPGSAPQPAPTPSSNGLLVPLPQPKLPPPPPTTDPISVLLPLPQPTMPAPPAPAPAPRTPIFAQPLAFLQIHQGDTPQSLASFWDAHGFNFTAQQLIDSNRNTAFLPGNTWLVWGAGQGPNTVVGFK